jgi:hypothetical protein
VTPPDIAGSIDRVLEHLKPNGQRRRALENANLLLTNLMALLRENGKRENGFSSVEESRESQRLLAELFTSRAQTQDLYESHRLRSHIPTTLRVR